MTASPSLRSVAPPTAAVPSARSYVHRVPDSGPEGRMGGDSLAMQTMNTVLAAVLACVRLGELDVAASLLSSCERLARTQSTSRQMTDQLVRIRRDLGFDAAIPVTRPPLTRAEAGLLPRLATHLSLLEIAEERHVSRHTVKTQAMSIYRKLNVSSRSQAVDRASELGLIQI
jgi:LuxR family transcriptional regulator, maltose regulon positive regulatory protein